MSKIDIHDVLTSANDKDFWESLSSEKIKKAKYKLDTMGSSPEKLTYIQELQIDRCSEIGLSYDLLNRRQFGVMHNFELRGLMEILWHEEPYMSFLIGEECKVRLALDNMAKYGFFPSKATLLEVDNKTDFAELIQALYLSKAVKYEGDAVTQTKLIEALKTVFDISYHNFSKTISESYNRKDSGSFLSRLCSFLFRDKENKNN